jgi:hypothetical protein
VGDLSSEDDVTGASIRMWNISTFPVEHLEASRRDQRLQARERGRIEETMRANPGLKCPECASDSGLAWFWFESPAWTWEQLCGRAGVVAFCAVHGRQAAFELRVVN